VLPANLEFHMFYASHDLQVRASRHFNALEKEHKASSEKNVQFLFYDLVDKSKDRVSTFKRLYYIVYLIIYSSFHKQTTIVTDLNPTYSIWNNIVVNINDLRELVGFKRHPDWLLKIKHYFLKNKKIVTISTHTKRQLESIGCKNVTLIHCGLKRNDVKDYNRINKDIDVLVVGQFSARKNHMIVLKAMEKINSVNDNVNAVFVGANGPEFKRLYQYKDENSIDCVELIKNVSDQKLDELYTRSKILILPTFYEGFGVPAVEGYSYNCEVLLSDYEAAIDFKFNYDLISNYNHEQVFRKIHSKLERYDTSKYNDMNGFPFFYDDIIKNGLQSFFIKSKIIYAHTCAVLK
jgi:glycosyltransferase involved in cell wall biosynthesis